jgi:hypothetical protein
MIHNHRSLLTSCFTILLVVALFGSASAAFSTRSSAVTPHRYHPVQMPHRHSLYNFYNYSGLHRPDCYLPSDGCDSEYSVQN